MEIDWFIPFGAALFISAFSSVGGVSGAFLLLPIQMSFFGIAGPVVSSTNLVYNVVAIPAGVYRFYRERRLVLPLIAAIVVGTLPGLFVGAIIRIELLPDPRYFKAFVAVVLFYIALRMLIGLIKPAVKTTAAGATYSTFETGTQKFSAKSIEFTFQSETYSIHFSKLFILSLIVGLIGGVYGIGGGAIIAPFLVSVFKLPVYAIAGAALASTFISSVAGVAFYSILAVFYSADMPIAPNWKLGLLFGSGGAVGIYLGARIQRHLPEKFIKSILVLVLFAVVVKYLFDFLFAN